MTTEMTISDLRAAITAALKRRDPEAGLWQAISNDRRATWAATVRRVELVVSAHGPAADLDALRALAAACGLREDGSDPASEVERLAAERALVDAEWRRDMADLRAQMERARHEATKDYDAARAEIERLRADNASLDDVAKGALDDLARVRAELSALATRFEQLRVSRYALEGQCRELHRALARRKARIARQRADAERFRQERNAARAAVRAFAPQCSQCEALATRRLDGYGDGEAARCDGCSPSPMEHSWSHDLPHAAAIRAAGGVR